MSNVDHRLFKLGKEATDQGLNLYVASTGETGVPIPLTDAANLSISVSGEILAKDSYSIIPIRSLSKELMSISFVSDYSESMTNHNLSMIKNLYSQFSISTRGLAEAELITFADIATVQQPFTSDSDKIISALHNDATYQRGATALYDGMGLAHQMLTAAGTNPIKIMIVSTDGLENVSTRYSKQQLVDNIASSEAFVLMLGSFFANASDLEAIAGPNGAYIYSYSLKDAQLIARRVMSSLHNSWVIQLDQKFKNKPININFNGKTITFNIGQESL